MASGGARLLMLRSYEMAMKDPGDTLVPPQSINRTAIQVDSATLTVHLRTIAIGLLVRHQGRSNLLRRRREVCE